MLLEKLEILNKTEIIHRVSTGRPDLVYLWMAILILLFLTAMPILHYFIDSEWPAFLCTLLIVAVLLGGVKLLLSEADKEEEIHTGRYRYTAIIEDAELLKEVYENYYIVGSEGIIYVFEDKKTN